MSDSEAPTTEQRWPNGYPSLTLNQKPFEPVDTSALTKTAFYQAITVGGILAAGQTSLANDGRGALSIFTKSGKLWAGVIAIGTSYKFALCTITNLREKNDSINNFFAGTVAGSVLGSFTKSLVTTVGTSIGIGLLCAFTNWSGGPLGNRENSAAYARGGIENNLLNKKYKAGEMQGFFELSRRRPLSEAKERLGDTFMKP